MLNVTRRLRNSIIPSSNFVNLRHWASILACFVHHRDKVITARNDLSFVEGYILPNIEPLNRRLSLSKLEFRLTGRMAKSMPGSSVAVEIFDLIPNKASLAEFA